MDNIFGFYLLQMHIKIIFVGKPKYYETDCEGDEIKLVNYLLNINLLFLINIGCKNTYFSVVNE